MDVSDRPAVLCSTGAHDVPSSSRLGRRNTKTPCRRRRSEGACHTPPRLSAVECHQRRKKYLDQRRLAKKAEEFGYDREVLQEAYARQIKANERLERGRYHGCAYASSSDSSADTTSSDEPYYLPRDYSPAPSFESDRSWHLRYSRQDA